MQSASNILRCGAARLLVGATIVAIPAVGWAEESEYGAQLKLPTLGERDADGAARDTSKPRLNWETGEGKSYLYRHHAVALKYVLAHREAHYPDLGDRHQTMGTIGLYYAWISDSGFGAVEWRDAAAASR